MNNFITAGKVIHSYGLRGQLKVDVYLENLSLLRASRVFFVGDSLLEKKINFLKCLKKSIWVVAIADISNRDQADQLRGQLIFLEKKYLPSLTANEFYYGDLKGLQIKIDGGQQKGYVNEVYNFGSGDILEVSLEDMQSTRYIPFNKDNVSKIDVVNGIIILTPLKGLLS